MKERRRQREDEKEAEIHWQTTDWNNNKHRWWVLLYFLFPITNLIRLYWCGISTLRCSTLVGDDAITKKVKSVLHEDIAINDSSESDGEFMYSLRGEKDGLLFMQTLWTMLEPTLSPFADPIMYKGIYERTVANQQICKTWKSSVATPQTLWDVLINIWTLNCLHFALFSSAQLARPGLTWVCIFLWQHP